MNDFSDIAYAKFLQTAPELSNLILTFKDVSEEMSDSENSDIQVGLFILRAGQDVLFVPVISKGDGVYPIDSIFINSKGKFFPLTKNTVEYILTSLKPTLGKSKKIPKEVNTNPSVYDIINPPRTGKFVYASASRLTEFLAILPSTLKKEVLEKFASDPEVYGKLHKMFGLENILTPLMEKAAITVEAPFTEQRDIGVKIITEGNDLPQPIINTILSKGYAIDGHHPRTRIALQSENWLDGRYSTIGSIDAGFDHSIVMKDGSTRKAYIPIKKVVQYFENKDRRNKEGEPLFMIYENGDFSIGSGAVCLGQKSPEKEVIRNLFEFNPPILLKDVQPEDTFAIFGDNMDIVGVFYCSKIMLTFDGCMIEASDIQRLSKRVTIQGIRGYNKAPVDSGKELFVPMSSLVVRLGERICDKIEHAVMDAARRRELIEQALVNSTLNLTFDNVEFSVNGKSAGDETDIMILLVEKEGIDPNLAESFVKRAKENKKTTIYLSKRADFEPGEIPQFGNPPPNQVNPWGTQSDKLPMNNMKAALGTNDNQTVESVVISELLQSPDLYEHITEYLPDIEEAIDKLGRILFLGRIHLDKLGDGNDADEIFSFLGLLRNVYKMLGDSYIKLERFAGNVTKV